MRSLFRTAFISFAVLLPVVSLPAYAQTTPVRGAATGPGELHGRLVSQASTQPVASGSITIRRAADSVVVAGALPKADGTFHVDRLPVGRYTVRVRALGFAPYVSAVVAITAATPVVDVGSISLSVVVAKLEGQQVVAEREEVELAPDRNSYGTKNMTTASGGTAIDVLRNVPSVEVDGSNKVSLRGNENVVVQINGRSSPLKGEQLGAFLAQLPSSAVKSVEVATNPSAKNDPEGTAGIINIVLAQETELGLSGGFNAGTGSTGMANMSGNIGRQSGPLTLFLSGSVSHDRRATSGTIDRTNLFTSAPAFVETSSIGAQHPMSGGMTLRSEYRFNKTDALSFDAFAYGGHNESVNALYYSDLNTARDVVGLFSQFNDQASNNLSQDYTVAWRRTGGPKATSFSSELRYSQNNNTSGTELYGDLQQADAGAPLSIPREHDQTVGGYPTWNWQTDYSHPFGMGTKLESGFKGTLRSTNNDFSAAYFDSTSGLYIPNALRATNFGYREEIGAGYVVVSQRMDKVQAQAGLRLEDAGTRLDLPSASLLYDNHYASAFPSGIVSYNLSDTRLVKMSYSRRISRPNPYQLSPIEVRQDSRNVFHGNPNLRPEYTDALELGLQDAHGWGSIQLNPYVRKTAHAVRNIQTVDSTGVSVSTYDNVASTTTVGTDLNVNWHGGPITIFGGGGAYRYSSDASNLAGNLSAKALVWSLRSNITWKFNPVADAQVFANYRAPYATEGGSQTAFVFMNMAARYKLWGDNGNISLRLSDPFNLMKFGYRTVNDQVVEQSERRFGQRAVFLTVSRSFGQALKLRPKQQDPDPQQQGPPAP